MPGHSYLFVNPCAADRYGLVEILSQQRKCYGYAVKDQMDKNRS